MAGSHGFRRPVIGMATAVLAMFHAAGQVPGQVVVMPNPKPKRRFHNPFGTGRGRGGSNCKKPHQGNQECARRVRQTEAGTYTPNYVHGHQYPASNPYNLEHWGSMGLYPLYCGKKW